MINVNVIGAGGHARSLLSLIAEDKSVQVNGVFDISYDKYSNEKIGYAHLVGTPKMLEKVSGSIVLAIGDVNEKKLMFEQFESRIYSENIIAQNALIRENVQMGIGNHVLPFAFLNSEAKLGNHCLINSRATIEHESIIGNFCHIAVGAIVCGRVVIGNNTFIGAGSVIKDGVKICDDVIVGAGAVVVKDIVEPGTYIGNPLRKIK